KTIGDTVSTKEPLFDVSSDKVEMEVPAPAEGTLLEIRIEAGTTVPVGEVIAVIVREGEVIEAKAAAPAAVRAEAEMAKADAAGVRGASVKAANRDAK
ncbi:MAG: biotin/lipoyl-containing protein, partial [Alphaproteobacteria bacterium]